MKKTIQNKQKHKGGPRSAAARAAAISKMDREIGEEWRLQGNDAFGTGDYERALLCYDESVQHFPQANTLSNKAAVLHKLGRYSEALEAANRCTELDPGWAKGWWRRGVAAELMKDFPVALAHYCRAANLEPKNATFQKHLQDVKKRLNLINNGAPLQELDIEMDQGDHMATPAIKAFHRVLAQVQDEPWTIYNLNATYENYIQQQQQQQQQPMPTSMQYLARGITHWISGLKCAIADLSSCLSPENYVYGNILKQRLQNAPESVSAEEVAEAEEMLGGLPTSMAMNDMLTGYAQLGGTEIFIEMAPGQFCPQPHCLRQYMAYQILAQLHCIQKWVDLLMEKEYDFGPNMKCAPAILEAYATFFGNLRAPAPMDLSHKSSNCTPQELVDYIKEQLQAGRQWEHGGIRAYIALMFRGTVLYATICRGMGQQFARALGFLKWSREFITLLDEEFKVTEQRDFEEKGTFFKPSLRIGIMLAELDLLGGLCGGSPNGPYTLRMVFDLCCDISEMALNYQEFEKRNSGEDNESYGAILDEVAYFRKPRAIAHSKIASNLNLIRCNCGGDMAVFTSYAACHGLVTEEEEDDYDPFALIAKHYLIAAQNELPDAEEGSIYWWAYAANLAQSNPDVNYSGKRTLGELRSAIRTAQANENVRDVDLFGENLQKNGEYESIAKLTAEHFEDQPDSFVFPQVRFVRKGENVRRLEIHDGDGNVTETICDDFEQYSRNELRRTAEEKRRLHLEKLLDTCNLEGKYGCVAGNTPVVPSLATLSIRELHKAGASFARGETCGDVIIEKAMKEAMEDNGFDKENTH